MRKLLLMAAVLFPATAVQAQGTEIGVGLAQLSLQTCSGCDSYTQFAVTPVGVTLAFYPSEKIGIEPGLSLLYGHVSGNTSTNIGLQVGVPIYPKGGWGHEGMYIEPLVALLYNKDTGNDAVTRFGAGLGVGTKIKVSDPVSLRVGVSAAHVFKKDLDAAYNMFAGEFGVSFFFGQ